MALFGTAGIRGAVDSDMTPERALGIGRAIGIHATRTDTAARIIVGRDGRTTSTTIADALMSGIESAGVPVVDVGELPTPALAFAARGTRGVMVTASHNPPSHNGIKVFRDGVEYDRAAERELADIVRSHPPPVTWADWTHRETRDVLCDYREAVVTYGANRGDSSLDVSVGVDCGNGVTSHVTPRVLRALGARVTTLNGNVDGFFPGRQSKPTREAIRDLRAFIAGDSLDLGVAHDGDGDRIVVVDDTGGIVHEDTILAVLAEHYTRASAATDPVVVTTPNTSGRIDERVQIAGGRTERVQLGRLHDGIARIEHDSPESTVVFAGEPWKHIHPTFGGWIDGVVSAVVLAWLVADAGSLHAVTDPVRETPARKVSVRCPDHLKPDVMEVLGDALPAAFDEAALDTTAGIRLSFPDESWVLVRPSGTEARLRIYAESPDVDSLIATTRSIVTDTIADLANQ